MNHYIELIVVETERKTYVKPDQEWPHRV